MTTSWFKDDGEGGEIEFVVDYDYESETEYFGCPAYSNLVINSATCVSDPEEVNVWREMSTEDQALVINSVFHEIDSRKYDRPEPDYGY